MNKKLISPFKMENKISHFDLFSRSPPTFPYRKIQSKFNFKPRIKNNATYLHDLSCTLAINLKEIINIKNNGLLSKEQFKIIYNKISIISGLFRDLRLIHKNKKKLKSKILVNNQLVEEIKRRKNESLLILQAKKLDLIKSLNKKEIIIRKYKKKFSDIEIYIRRECQSYVKYKNLYIHFYMDSFIIKNTKILNIIKNKKQENDEIKDLINIVNYENIEYKKSCYYFSYNDIENDNNKKSLYNINNINKLLIIQEDKNKYFKNEIEEISKIYKNMLKEKFVIKSENKNNFTNKILNSLNQLPFDENKSNLFKSEIDINNSYLDHYNPDSSDLWSASEIEK